jgi:histidine triad (HIT) family protein
MLRGMPTIFSRIVEGEIPAHKVLEDDQHLAFLDIQPLADGHTLVVPKKEVDYLFDLDPDAHTALWAFVQKVARGLKRATGCERVTVAVMGWEVPHAHVHLVPTNRLEDFPIPPRLERTPDELAATAQRVRAAL